jgi:hypothetical protein
MNTACSCICLSVLGASACIAPLMPWLAYAGDRILAYGSNQCIRPESSFVGAPITINSCDGAVLHKWWFQLLSPNTYLVVNSETNLCLTVPGGSMSSQTATIQYPCRPLQTGASWTLQSASGGLWIITNVNSGLVLDIYQNTVQQYGYTGGSNQLFVLSGNFDQGNPPIWF